MTDAQVHCPLVTPFDDAGEVDVDALETVAESALDAGIDGLVPCGTTGEFASLTREEHRAVLEAAVDAADGDAPVVAGAAATSVSDTVDYLDLAERAGADAGLVVVPYFHPANAPEGNARFLRRVAEASPLPLYLYNIPSCTGSEIAVETVSALAEYDAVRGLKDSSGDFGYFTDVLAATPDDFAVLQGVDDHLVPGRLMGSDGGVNALSNAIPEAFVAARDALDAGETARAREIQLEAIKPLFDYCAEYGFAPAAKAALAARGIVETDAVRPPLVPLDDDVRADVSETVDDALALVE